MFGLNTILLLALLLLQSASLTLSFISRSGNLNVKLSFSLSQKKHTENIKEGLRNSTTCINAESQQSVTGSKYCFFFSNIFGFTAKGMVAVMRERRWLWDNKEWEENVAKSGTIEDDGIVDGLECCQICKERYPETKAWQKFVDYQKCECFSFSDDFDPINQGLTHSHGAYTVGVCWQNSK